MSSAWDMFAVSDRKARRSPARCRHLHYERQLGERGRFCDVSPDACQLLGAPLATLAAVTVTSALTLSLRVAFLRRPPAA